MQLVGFSMFDTTRLPPDYAHVLEAVLLEHLEPFNIRFHSLIVTRSNVVLVGDASLDVNWARECIRQCLRTLGYPLFEPYKSDTCHMTLVRFTQALTEQQEACLHAMLQRSLQPECTQSLLGVLHVDSLCVSPASWKMLPQELPDHHTKIQFEDPKNTKANTKAHVR